MARPTKYDWDKIQSEYEAGIAPAEIVKKYDVPFDSLSHTIKKKSWVVNQQAKAIISGFNDISQEINQVAEENPALAKKIVDIVTEKHPEFKKAMVALSSKLFNRMLKIADEATASEILPLTKGMQTITDTLGISQRHANSQINVTNTNAQQNNTTILTQEQMKDELKRRGLPIEL